MSKPIRLPHEINISGFHSIYYLELGKDFYHSQEKHDFWEMVYVDSGKTTATRNTFSYQLVQGQVVFHRPGELHSHFSNNKDPSNLFVVWFSCPGKVMSFFEEKIFMLEKNSKKILSLFLAESENALGKLNSGYLDASPLDFQKSPFGAPQLMECYFIEFLYSLIRSNELSIHNLKMPDTTASIADNALVNKINDYLEKNLYYPLNLQEVCEHFNLSKSYLCKIYKDYTSQGIMKHFTDLKIKEAKKLLRQDELNISQIADILGYSGIHNFTRSFKSGTGFSPTEYKKKL